MWLSAVMKTTEERIIPKLSLANSVKKIGMWAVCLAELKITDSNSEEEEREERGYSQENKQRALSLSYLKTKAVLSAR